ncbi:hypothetical protein [Paenibacillus sp. LPE1-1-1.1]|uniref:hypothetical protein n=1 Tax=Paenibacillus sp. LPE1-1-1.1 TaxID=3135230 RepID=UPI0034478C94
MNHLISLKEYDADTLQSIIEQGIAVKNSPERFYHAAERKGLLMLFHPSSMAAAKNTIRARR